MSVTDEDEMMNEFQLILLTVLKAKGKTVELSPLQRSISELLGVERGSTFQSVRMLHYTGLVKLRKAKSSGKWWIHITPTGRDALPPLSAPQGGRSGVRASH